MKTLTTEQAELIARALYGPRFYGPLMAALGRSESYKRFVIKNGLNAKDTAKLKAIAGPMIETRRAELNKARAILSSVDST